jgi:diketogulonate reductase-like aldo/keto reductase
MSRETVTLRSGAQMPLVGFGTYQVKSHSVIKQALIAGYRMFDTSSCYNNEWIIGDCVSRSAIRPKELFLVSKAWNDVVFDGVATMRYQMTKSMHDLRREYIDLYMIHWPVPGKFAAVYRTIEEMHDLGKIRDIGISNFTIEDYEELLASGIRILPSVIQIEVSTGLYRPKTIEYFLSKGLHVMSYRGFSKSQGLEDGDVVSLAEKYKRTPAQILGRFLVQQGISHIPKSNDSDRMVSNKDIFSFELSADDMEILKHKTTDEAKAKFREHYLSSRIKDTHYEYHAAPPAERFTVD